MTKTLTLLCVISTNLFCFTSFSQTIDAIECKNIEVTLNDEGQAEIQPLDLLNTDLNQNDHHEYELSVEKSLFSCNDLGNNTVRLTALFEDGSTLRCEGRVKVDDVISPVALCKDVEMEESSVLQITSDLLDNGSFDNCSVEFEVYETGTEVFESETLKTYVLKAKDNRGNISECTSEVRIIADLDEVVDEVLFGHITEATNVSKDEQPEVSEENDTKSSEQAVVSITEGAIDIYPNPATEYVTFKSKNSDAVFTAKIMTNYGTTLKRFDLFKSGEKLSLDGLEPGTYIFEVSLNGTGIKKSRLIIE